MDSYNHKNDWFYEGNISKKLITYFKKNNYLIVKDNSENIRARGEDIIVSLKGQIEIIEVKGFPTTLHTKGINKGKPKATDPKLQAKNWFGEAILSCIFNYHRQKGNPDIKLALGFPLFDRYKELVEKAEDFFSDNDIDLKLYFVDDQGNIFIENLNKNKKPQHPEV